MPPRYRPRGRSPCRGRLLSECDPSPPNRDRRCGRAGDLQLARGVFDQFWFLDNPQVALAASKAIPVGPLKCPLAGIAILTATAGVGLPLEAHWLAVNSTTLLSTRLATQRSPFSFECQRDGDVYRAASENHAGRRRSASAQSGRGELENGVRLECCDPEVPVRVEGDAGKPRMRQRRSRSRPRPTYRRRARRGG